VESLFFVCRMFLFAYFPFHQRLASKEVTRIRVFMATVEFYLICSLINVVVVVVVVIAWARI
jgi:hypothetical protein